MRVLIWSKDFCGYCDGAKQLLKQKGIQFEERKIGSGWTKEQLLESVPSAKTVPQIIIDGKLIGGFTELRQYFQDKGE